jgi:hypothetical protein
MLVVCVVMHRKLTYLLCLKGGGKIPGIFRAKQEIFYGRFNRTVFKLRFLNTNILIIQDI